LLLLVHAIADSNLKKKLSQLQPLSPHTFRRKLHH
jgi:hypothetical protein